jgi:hypothetical protein
MMACMAEMPASETGPVGLMSRALQMVSVRRNRVSGMAAAPIGPPPDKVVA